MNRSVAGMVPAVGISPAVAANDGHGKPARPARDPADVFKMPKRQLAGIAVPKG